MSVSSLPCDTDLWAAQLAEHADLPDARLQRRFAEVLAAFAHQPLDSIPQAAGSHAAAKATYRFLQNTRVASDDLLEAAATFTAETCRGLPVVLAVHDTTSLNYSHLDHTTGLGPIGATGSARGLHLHSTLALRSDGLTLGLLHQEYWSREDEPRRGDHQTLPIEHKESCKWLDGIAGAEDALAHLAGQRPRVIHLMDREGDIHEVLERLALSRDGAVIRSAQNRSIEGPIPLAHHAANAAEPLGVKLVSVPAASGRPAREAKLELRALRVTLAPSAKHPGQVGRHPVAIWLVDAREIDAPPDAAPLHWQLWTTEPAATFAAADEIVRLYTLRWRIEEFHLTLKSGCRAESLELETADRLTKAVMLYSAVAVRLVSLRDWARRAPTAPCTVILSDDAWKALWWKFNPKQRRLPAAVPTVAQTIRWIGRLGGHLNRKRDGEPGVRTLWRGWRDLTLLVSGFRLARAAG